MNNHLKTILKIFGSEIVLKVILGFTSIFIARELENLAYSNFFFFITVTNLCVNIPSSFFNKLFFTDKNKSVINRPDIFSVVFCLSLISLLSIILIVLVVPFKSFLLFILSIFLIVIRIIYLYNQTILQSELNFRKLYFKELIRVLFYVLPTIIYLFFASIIQIEIIILIIFLSFSLIELIFKIDSKFHISFQLLKQVAELFLKNKDIFLVTISLFILTSIDTIMLKKLSNATEMANFGAAFTLYSFLMLGLGSIHKYILPKISNSNVSQFNNIIRPILRVGYFLIVFLLIGINFTESVFNFIFGLNKFPKAHVLFNVLSLSAVLSYFFSPYNNILNKVGAYKIQLYTYLMGIISIVSFNYFLIPIYGAISVVISNLIVYFFVNFILFIKAKQIIKLEIN